MIMSLTSPKRLLPLMIFVGVLMIGMRLSALWETSWDMLSSSPKMVPVTTRLSPSALANTETKKETKTTQDAKTTPRGSFPRTSDRTAPSVTRSSFSDSNSSSTVALIKQLAARREVLDKREAELKARDSITQVAEKRIDQKIQEMESLRVQLQSMVNQLNSGQQQQVANLVKIYETMKAPEAARILETLEMPVLLGVIQRMKPARTAAIMANMNPQKAKDITESLTKQDELPAVK